MIKINDNRFEINLFDDKFLNFNLERNNTYKIISNNKNFFHNETFYIIEKSDKSGKNLPFNNYSINEIIKIKYSFRWLFIIKKDFIINLKLKKNNENLISYEYDYVER